MDALGLITTAAIFSEKSNIELRIFVTPQVIVPANSTLGTYTDIPGAQNLNVTAVGIINTLRVTSSSTYVNCIVFSTIYTSPLTYDNSEFISLIDFIYQNNARSFNLSRDSNPRYRYGISIKLTSSGSLQVAATSASGDYQQTALPQIIPCILIY